MLPKTAETLWLRILGKGRAQAQAILEVAALPAEHPQRDNVLELLGNLKVILEARVTIEPEEQDLIMQLSPLYLAKIQAAELVGEERGENRMLLRLMNRRFGDIPTELYDRIGQFNVVQLENLGEALLDFKTLMDLEVWLNQN